MQEDNRGPEDSPERPELVDNLGLVDIRELAGIRELEDILEHLELEDSLGLVDIPERRELEDSLGRADIQELEGNQEPVDILERAGTLVLVDSLGRRPEDTLELEDNRTFPYPRPSFPGQRHRMMT